MKRRYLIVDDTGDGRPLYHVRLGLGMFNECSHQLAEARRFETRRAAVRVWRLLRHGFRIIPE